MYVYVKLTDYTLVIRKDDRRHVYRKGGFRSRTSRERLMRLLKGAEYYPSLERDGMDTAIVEEWIIDTPAPVFRVGDMVQPPIGQRRVTVLEVAVRETDTYYAVNLLEGRARKWYTAAELTAAIPAPVVNPAIREAFRLQTALCAALDMDEAAYTHEAQQLVASGKLAPDANKFTVDHAMWGTVLFPRFLAKSIQDPAWADEQREIVKAAMS